MTSITKRCNPAVRRAFAERYQAEKRTRGPYSPICTAPEPALGTLSERLDIIIRRLGGTTGPVRALKWERELFAVTQESI